MKQRENNRCPKRLRIFNGFFSGACAVQVTLAALKLCSVVDWPWTTVCIPTYVSAVIAFFVCIWALLDIAADD